MKTHLAERGLSWREGLLGLAFGLAPPLLAATWHVAPNGLLVADGASWETATTLPSALERASAGDEIWLQGGTYHPTANLDETARFDLKSGFALYGGFGGDETERSQRDPGAHPTILSGDLEDDDDWPDLAGPGTIAGVNTKGVVQASDAIDLVLDGLTITGASGGPAINFAHVQATVHDVRVVRNASDLSSAGFWATDCTLVIEDSFFAQNQSSSRDLNGAGLNLDHCVEARVIGCRFLRNRTEGHGGALFARRAGDLIVANCRIENNRGDLGAGVSIDGGRARISGCRFRENGGNNGGGGLYGQECERLRVEWSEFVRNESDRGGGCQVHDCQDTRFRRVRFVANNAEEGEGGGLYVTERAVGLFDVGFLHNSSEDRIGGGLALCRTEGTTVMIGAVFASNPGGAISLEESGPLSITNATITGNTEGGFAAAISGFGGDVDLTNTIVWEPGGQAVQVDLGTLTEDHSNVGAFDPRFADPTYEAGPDLLFGTEDDLLPDLRLQAGSESIDAGIAYALMPEVDLQGLDRLLGAAIDQGAYEFAENPGAVDTDRDGVPDVEESIAGTSIFSANSKFGLVFGLAEVPGGEAAVSWKSAPDRLYVIECSTDLREWSAGFEHYSLEGDEEMRFSKPRVEGDLFLRARVIALGGAFFP